MPGHRRATTHSFQDSYRRWRPMVERSIAWLVADGRWRVPYRGVQRNELWWSLRVAAVNLRRLLVLGLARHDGDWVLARHTQGRSGPIMISAALQPSDTSRSAASGPVRSNDRPDRSRHLQQAPSGMAVQPEPGGDGHQGRGASTEV